MVGTTRKRTTKTKRAMRGAGGQTLIVGLVLCLLSLFSWGLLAPSKAFALGVSPPTIDIGNMQPGETKEFETTVFNPNPEGGTPMEVTCEVVDFSKDEKGSLGKVVRQGEGVSEEATKVYRFASYWVTILGENSFILPPQGQKKIKMRVTVPQAAEPGGKYFGLMVTGKPPAAEGSITFHDSVLCQCFLVVGGERVVDMEIGPPEFSKGLFSTKVKYRVTLRNKGNTHLDIRGLFLRFYHKGEVDKEEDLGTPLLPPIVPGLNEVDYRIIEGELTFPAWPRRYQSRVECGYPVAINSPVVSLFIFPLWLFLLIVGVLCLLIAFVVWKLLQKRKKKGGGRPKRGKGEGRSGSKGKSKGKDKGESEANKETAKRGRGTEDEDALKGEGPKPMGGENEMVGSPPEGEGIEGRGTTTDGASSPPIDSLRDGCSSVEDNNGESDTKDEAEGGGEDEPPEGGSSGDEETENTVDELHEGGSSQKKEEAPPDAAPAPRKATEGRNKKGPSGGKRPSGKKKAGGGKKGGHKKGNKRR